MSNKFLLSTIVAAVAAVVLNVGVYILAQSQGIELGVSNQAEPVSLGIIIVMSIIPVAAAGVVYWLWQRTLGNAPWPFFWIATIIGIISLVGPLTLATSLGSMVMLSLMHIVVTMAITYNLTVGDWEGVGSEGAIIR